MRLFALAHGATAPSASDFSRSGMMRSASHTISVPRPWHSGHAPKWELKEKCFGVSWPSVKPVSGLLKSVEYLCSSQRSGSAPSTRRSTTSRLTPHFSAVSTLSASRVRTPSLMMSRSTTTSIVCVTPLPRRIGSGRPSSMISPSMRTRTKPSRFNFSSTSRNSPTSPRTIGASTAMRLSGAYAMMRSTMACGVSL